MKTTALLQKYLVEELRLPYKNIKVNAYRLNGSTIFLSYSYEKDSFMKGSIYVEWDNKVEVELLHYIAFVYTLCSPERSFKQ